MDDCYSEEEEHLMNNLEREFEEFGISQSLHSGALPLTALVLMIRIHRVEEMDVLLMPSPSLGEHWMDHSRYVDYDPPFVLRGVAVMAGNVQTAENQVGIVGLYLYLGQV